MSLLQAGLVLLAATGCAAGFAAPAAPSTEHRLAEGPPPVQRLRVEVIEVFPHDREAFTQGLVWHEGWLYESTGLHGRSSLRRVDRVTGGVALGVLLPGQLFGEGLALVDGLLIQLTWQEGVALVYDLATLGRVGEFRYQGEGWGLCYDGGRLVMSDGSSSLWFRDAQTFEVVGSVTVTFEGVPVELLNELECVGDHVYANVWQTDSILRVDPSSGRVVAVIDASGLLSPPERLVADVLNGIAFDPERETFLIAGKFWPRLFEVRFVE